MKKILVVAPLFLANEEVLSMLALVIIAALVIYECVKKGLEEKEERKCSDMN